MKKLILILALIASPAFAGEGNRKAEWLQCHQQAVKQSYAIMYEGELRAHARFAYVVDLIECMNERGYALDRDRCPSASSLEFWCWKEFAR
jgi:hypothetical protein